MNLSKYDIERSLLQKAVRRGNEAVVEKVIKYLFSVGDEAWLKKRLFVITYEECWPLGNTLSLTNLFEEYLRLTRAVKNKNAAGLAALATKYNEGYSDVLFNTDFADNINSVASAINSPNEFWKFVESQPGYSSNWNRIEAAKIAASKASFTHDKALMYAAACLCVEEAIPATRSSTIVEMDFPYWTAFDKHTEKGRVLITDSSKKVGLDPYIGMELTFYMEGAMCNEMVAAPYWNHYVSWRIKKLGPAVAKWDDLREVLIKLSTKDVASLLKRINGEEVTSQLSLF